MIAAESIFGVDIGAEGTSDVGAGSKMSGKGRPVRPHVEGDPMATREGLVNDTLARLADTLVADFDLLDYLDLLLERSSVVLDAAAGGVMLADERGDLQVLASSDEPTRLMELYELERQDGPCLEAHRRGEAIAEGVLATSKRWPQFASYALQLGFQAAFAFPLRLRGESVGALNLFRRQSGGIPTEDLRVAQTLAHMAAIGILQQRAVRQAQRLSRELQGALNSRVVIEQAKGIVAERTGGEIGGAYQLLRWYARNHNLAIREVATAIVSRSLAVEDLLPEDGG